MAHKVCRDTAAVIPRNFWCNWTTSAHSESCDRLTAAIEARDRETVDAACALIRRHEGGDILEAEVRSLSPKGTTPATKEVTRG